MEIVVGTYEELLLGYKLKTDTKVTLSLLKYCVQIILYVAYCLS